MERTTPRKYIIVTGGVLSGLGKGIAGASIGHLLSSLYKVVPIKLDGYLNVDPGTMNPTEHGEVFVLDDGAEVDMDFGHYERFLNTTCKKEQNLTMGKVFQGVREKERRGDYLGKTVQYIPHVVNYIKGKFFDIAQKENADIVLIEVGGTVGDIENELYIEAVRQLKKEVGPHNICYVHLTYIPIPSGVNEQKSKPTQQSINQLQQRGIQPDIIIGRCSEYLTQNVKQKIALFSDLTPSSVFSGLDVDSVYKLPAILKKQGILDSIEKTLGITLPQNVDSWEGLLKNINNPTQDLTIAICGKYTKLEDSYASINEALLHCGAHTSSKIQLQFIETTKIEQGNLTPFEALQNISGIIIPGGFGSRGTEGKLEIIKYARENNIPLLGICLGMQLIVVEFARNICLLHDANSTEINPSTPYPVVDILPEQKEINTKGGTMRLGAYTAHLEANSLAHTLYKSQTVSERHRHRYEINPQYHSILKQHQLSICGISEQRNLAEFIEIPNHPYFIATQGHPELKSSLLYPAPLFLGLVKAALQFNKIKINSKLEQTNTEKPIPIIQSTTTQTIPSLPNGPF
jgi:CTP synthase